MNVGQYQYIEQWEEENDLLLPGSEDDQHEYKSSRTSDGDLLKKISVAASAFWNTGGGIFVAGVDGNGKVDGGISATVGNTSRRDWVDLAIMKTQPPGPYVIRWIDKGTAINSGCGVLVIAFGESPSAHTAYDYKYYLRLGAHSQGANHYLVEALRAKKTFQSPILRALLQRSQRKSDVVDLAILVVNDATALNVQIILEPLTEWLKHFKEKFPLQIPVIDRSHPFGMELYAWGHRSETFGKDPIIKLIINYENAIGEKLQYTQDIDVRYNIDPMSIGDTDSEAIVKAVQDVSSQIKILHQTIASRRKMK